MPVKSFGYLKNLPRSKQQNPVIKNGSGILEQIYFGSYTQPVPQLLLQTALY